MTKLLEQAIAQIRELPEDQQDTVATNLMIAINDAISSDDERED